MKILKCVKPEFVDDRGGITRIVQSEVPMRAVLFITSKAGSVRANHYHKKDSHYTYILSGKMAYSEKPVEGGEITSVVLEAGDMVYTPPMMVHAMKFLEDSVFLACTTESREQSAYEADTIRVPIVS